MCLESVRKLNWYDISQYSAILLVAAATPINWRYGLWASLMLVLATVIKIIVQRKIGNPNINRSLQLALCSPIVYWLVLVISLFWSNDLETGLDLISRKAILFVFPLCFLLSDTTYLTSRQLRGIGYALTVSVCGVFLYYIVVACMAEAQGIGFHSFYNDYFSQKHRHHAYLAMYAVVAIIFVYYELYTYWIELKVWHRIAFLLLTLVLISKIILVNSRAGILVMVFSVILCILHLSITKRSWKLGIGATMLFALVFVVTTRLIPSYTDRVSETVNDYQEDVRMSIYRCNWHAICKNPIIGYGIGDSHTIQEETYKKEGFEAGVQSKYNAHNQYLDSLMAVGILGILSLLFFLFSSLIVAWFRSSKCLFWIFVLTGIVMTNLLFESMLERQMGLIFISGLYSIMVLIVSTELCNRFPNNPH